MGIISTLLANSVANPLATVMILSTLIFGYLLIIYPFFLSPLKEIPGPYLHKISKLLILNDQRLERRNEKLRKWHSKYGSVVQVSPTELSLSSFNHLKEIYIKKNFPKSDFYGQFINYGEPNSFSLLNTQQHIKRKKMMSRLYTKSAVVSHKSARHLNNKVNNVISFVSSRLRNPMDVYELFNSLAMDVVTYYELGALFATNLVLSINDREIIKAFRASSSTWFWTTLAPQFWNYAVSKKTQHDASLSADWTKTKFEEAYAYYQKHGVAHGETSLAATLFLNGFEKWAIGSEVFDHIAAGHETTGASLAFGSWELSRPMNAHMQDSIHDEVCCYFGDTPMDYIDLEELDRLEYLNAFVLEVERLHAAIPGSEPRVIGKGQAFEVELANGRKVKLPPGTVVSVQPWTIHNDSAVYVKPELFSPERWLQQEDETVEDFKIRYQDMRNRLFTFGQGNRMCLGMNVAVIEMKLVIAQLYWRYRSRVSSQWCSKLSNAPAVMGYSTFNKNTDKRELSDVELMSMADSYTSRPMYDECWLEWEPR